MTIGNLMKAEKNRLCLKKEIMKNILKYIIVLGIISIGITAFAQDTDRSGKEEKRGQKNDRPKESKGRPEDVSPSRPVDVILGRPTGNSIVLSVLFDEDTKAQIGYGLESSSRRNYTENISFKKGEPKEILLDKLLPDTQYEYILTDGASKKILVEGGFHTQRAPGSSFVFEIQGDSHPERPFQNDPVLYAQTLRAAAADKPDFYMTIGDDFSVDTLRAVNAETVAQRYQIQRPFLGLIGRTAPLFLVNGNHEQAALANLNGTADNVAVWAGNSRIKYYPLPEPDGFYTGDNEPVKFIGKLRDYYAFTWGDALFVTIDPYWHSPKAVDNLFGNGKKEEKGGKGKRDLWDSTLGDEQYKWLKKTLEESKAKYKFVFTHHVLGTGRGGIEQAGLCEWGGKDKKGGSDFKNKRPGWELPIHQLMVKNGVTIFFQGHDHIFVKQDLDGIVYQTLPDPANSNYEFNNNKEAYQSGDKFPGSGRVRVSVSPEKVKVEYVRSWLPKDISQEHPDGEISFSYELTAQNRK